MINKNKNNKKILVIEEIEDDTSLRKILYEKLTIEGFGVFEASNGENGLEVALREHPDLILLDILMPVMDGLEMMKKLREANEWGKNVPVILLTNLSPDDEKINKAITEHAPAYYLVKSDHTINDLIEKIRERLAKVA